MNQSTTLKQKMKQRDYERQLCYHKVGKAINKGGAIEKSSILLSQYWKNSQFELIYPISPFELLGCNAMVVGGFLVKLGRLFICRHLHTQTQNLILYMNTENPYFSLFRFVKKGLFSQLKLEIKNKPKPILIYLHYIPNNLRSIFLFFLLPLKSD